MNVDWPEEIFVKLKEKAGAFIDNFLSNAKKEKNLYLLSSYD